MKVAMKVAKFLGFMAAVSANIIFTHVPLHCNPDNPQIYCGCLRGQECQENGACVATSEPLSPSSCHALQPLQLRQAAVTLSADGTCGSAHGGTICDPKSTTYTGTCCSQYGWCGNTDAHCGEGCQSGCPTNNPNSNIREDGQCGAAFEGATCDPAGPYGGCCSQYGWCGDTPMHCLVADGCQNGCEAEGNSLPPTATGEPQLLPTNAATTTGTCGSWYGGTVCGNWPNGNCCSMYGFCGNTDAHCGAGCQSGDCISAPSIAPPGPSPAPLAANGGNFKVVGQSGVPAMHAALMPNGRVCFLDKIENYTQLTLPNGQYAYSSEYNPIDNTCVALAYATNAFCSGGSFLSDGQLVSLGGNAPLTWLDPTVKDGFNAIRYLSRSSTDSSFNGQSWSEPGNKLASDRWYATAQILPDGRMFVASGSLNGLDPAVQSNNNPTYEILSATGITEGNNIALAILQKNQPYYMYPFIHLLKDGTLFIFVSKSSEQFSLADNAPVQTYPDLPGDYRTYPNTGGSVLLPLSSTNNWNPEIMICGGGAYQDITSPTDPSCGRISPLSVAPTWEMDSMPEGRGMVEATILPDGTVLWLNGGSQGAQGFGLCTDPALEALLYNPEKPLGQRWSTMASSTIPRLYHSCALLLLDGTVMIAGSNPVQMPVLVADANNPYPTEFRVETYTPPYLQGANADRRPIDVVLSKLILTPDGSTFTVSFTSPLGAQICNVVLYHGGFVTHSIHMGHRMLRLDSTGWNPGTTIQELTVAAPPDHNVCPPGPYVVYVMCDGIPAMGQFISIAL